MSTKEIDRLLVVEQVVAKRLKQREGASQLGVSKRQMIRLIKGYRREGANALISKQRGKSNRGYGIETKERVQELIQQNYADFGPTLAAEKLSEIHQLSVNKETVRQWMMEWGLWKAKHQKQVKIHQSRARRPCRGELVQIDGSPHDWFEGRAEKCCLLVFIDDATSELLQLRFEPSETTDGYFKATRDYIERCGRPLAFYSDRAGIFRVSRPNQQGSEGVTQFARAMQELGIELICANSPQAKGRVERANGILQDRLVKELRLRGINDSATANAFLPEFMRDYNRRFAKAPTNSTDAHRIALPEKSVLDIIFSVQETRTLSKNLEFSYKNSLYQIQTETSGYRMRHAKILVCEKSTGEIILLYKGIRLEYTSHQKQPKNLDIVPAKELNKHLDKRHHVLGQKPGKNHPWRRLTAMAVASSKATIASLQNRVECIPAS